MAHITLFKSAETGKIFRPEDHNTNMTSIETAVNGHDDALSTVVANLALKADADDVTAALALKADADDLPANLSGFDGRLDDLEEQNTAVTSTVAFDSPATSGSAVLRRDNAVVVAQINIVQTGGFSTDDTVVSEQIPLAYRPLATVYAPAMFCTDADDGLTAKAGIVQITTDGYIKAVAPATLLTIMIASVSWVV